jgi:hypothetical protein
MFLRMSLVVSGLPLAVLVLTGCGGSASSVLPSTASGIDTTPG